MQPDYSAKIGAIFPEALPKELICGKSLHCPHRLECYSDFEPHFNEKKFLSDLIIGKMEWERHDNGESRGERWKTYGYNDTKWRYESQSQTSPLNLKLVVGSLGVVQICVQDGSAVPDFYVDISVTNVNANYVFKNSTKRWENVKRSDTACGRGRNSLHLGFELYGLPKGTHVLSIYNKNVAISHVLMWPDS